MDNDSNQIKLSKDPTTPFYSIVTFHMLLVIIYLIAHWLLPSSQDYSFFWVEPQIQWVDWLFWSISGVLLNLMSVTASQHSVSPGYTPHLSHTSYRIVRRVFPSLVVLVLINYAKINFSGIEINLSKEPIIGVSLAFIFGFYGKVTNKFFFNILWEFLKRNTVNILHRTIGKMDNRINEQTYIQRYIEPKLQPYYLLGASTKSGRNGHLESFKKLVRYKSAKFVGKAGFTLNALRIVFIGNIEEENLPEIIAHEASHVAQGFLSDSIDQETEAYITGVKVNFEIKNPNTEIPDDTRNEWLKIDKALSSTQFKEKIKARKKAEEKVRKLKKFAPLYGIIPIEQKKGLLDFIEMIRQGGFLLYDSIGLRDLLQK